MEQIKATYQQFPAFSILTGVGSAVLILILWDVVVHSVLISWFIAVLGISVIFPSIANVLYRRRIPAQASNAFWANLLILGACVNACLWGSIGIVFFVPELFVYQLVLFLWIYIPAALMMAMFIAFRPAFHISIVFLLLPLGIRTASEMDIIHLALATTVPLYAWVLMYFYRNSHNTLIESLTLRFKITEYAKELSIQKEEAERANQAKSQFLAAASHDLRQPLHAQTLFLAELDKCIHTPGCRRILGNLESSVNAMQRLFNAILDISRLDAGIVHIDQKHFLIETLLREYSLEYQLQSDEQEIELRVLPCSATVYSDPSLLNTIVRNLITNALRYTSNGRVLVGCRRQANHIRIEVWDTGIGIPENQQQEIFREYHQLRNPERDREKGLGLGLAIVKRTAELLDLPVEVVSVLGKGSMFAVVVPKGDPDKVKIQAQESAVSFDDVLHGACVLVIEDEISIREGMQGVLNDWGCQVLCVASAEEALVQLADWKYRADVIVADYRLRENRTGVQAIDEVRRAFNTEIPGILITGDTAPERLKEANSHHYPILYKPVQATKLGALLSYVLQNNR